MGNEEHWENIYLTKEDWQVSWYQETPLTSLQIIEELFLDKRTPILDVGAGNSNLCVELYERDYKDIRVLDISHAALERTQSKLGEEAGNIDWVHSDVLNYCSSDFVGLWHDRAVFHFLTSHEEKEKYLNKVLQYLAPEGYLVLATFSEGGPDKCSGLPVEKHTPDTLWAMFGDYFELLNDFEETHVTPFDTEQSFLYTVWRKK